jgi:hypothetical protein
MYLHLRGGFVGATLNVGLVHEEREIGGGTFEKREKNTPGEHFKNSLMI